MQGLDSLTERIRRIPPLALDAALGAALSLLSVLEFHELKPKDFPPSLHKHWSVYLFIGLTGLAVALRRRKLSVAYPLWVLTNIAVILTRSVWSEFSSGFLIEQVMVFSFAEQTPIPFAAALLILELGVDTGAISVFAKGVEWVPQIFNSFMLLGIVWFVGRATRRRKQLVEDLNEQTEELRLEQKRLAQQALATERQRIAAELRSLVILAIERISRITASAKSRLAADLPGAVRAIGRIEAIGRDAVIAMGRLVRFTDVSDEAVVGPMEVTPARAQGGFQLPKSAPRVSPALGSIVLFLLVVVAVSVNFVVNLGRFHKELTPGEQRLWLLLVGAMVLAVLFRRLAPFSVLALIASIDFFIIVRIGFFPWGDDSAIWSLLVGMYALASLRSVRWAAAGVVVGTLAWSPSVVHEGCYCTVHLFTWLIFTAIAGFSVQAGRRLIEELRGQAVVLQRTRGERLRLALERERSRVARDLHDTVAHGVTVMVVQAGAARMMARTDSDRAAELLDGVQTVAADALGELRSLVGSLSGPAETPPILALPGPRDIPSLVEKEAAGGGPVALEVIGQPDGLDQAMEISLYRIVQEALTNARKHAPGANAKVVFRCTLDWVEVEVVNGPPPTRAAIPVQGFGRGLIGIRERAALFGGEASAGSTPDGGFRVVARLPLELVSA